MPKLMTILGIDGRSFAAGLNSAVAEAKTKGNVIANHLGGVQSKLNEGARGFLGSKLSVGIAAIASEEAIRHAIDYAGKINDLSSRAGMAAESFQELSYAMEQSGGSPEDLVKFGEALAASRKKALAGDKATIANFSKLGVSVSDLKTKRNEDLTSQIGSAIQAGDMQELGPILKDIGGKAGVMLSAAFKDGIDDKREEARKAGVVMSQATIEALDEIGDRFHTLGLQLITDLAPAIISVSEFIQGLFDEVKKAKAFWGTLGQGGTWDEAARARDQVNFDIVEREEAKIRRRNEMRATAGGFSADGSGQAGKEQQAAVRAAEKLASVYEEIARIQERTAFNALSPEEKRAQLVRQVAELEQKIADSKKNSFNRDQKGAGVDEGELTKLYERQRQIMDFMKPENMRVAPAEVQSQYKRELYAVQGRIEALQSRKDISFDASKILSPDELAKAEKERAEKQEQLAGLKDQPRAFKSDLNELQRIGAYTAVSAADPAQQSREKQVQHLADISQAAKATNSALAEINRALNRTPPGGTEY